MPVARRASRLFIFCLRLDRTGLKKKRRRRSGLTSHCETGFKCQKFGITMGQCDCCCCCDPVNPRMNNADDVLFLQVDLWACWLQFSLHFFIVQSAHNKLYMVPKFIRSLLFSVASCGLVKMCSQPYSSIAGESISCYIFSPWLLCVSGSAEQWLFDSFSKIAPTVYCIHVSYCLKPGSLSR